jgi:hypothetical protein
MTSWPAMSQLCFVMYPMILRQLIRQNYRSWFTYKFPIPWLVIAAGTCCFDGIDSCWPIVYVPLFWKIRRVDVNRQRHHNRNAHFCKVCFRDQNLPPRFPWLRFCHPFIDAKHHFLKIPFYINDFQCRRLLFLHFDPEVSLATYFLFLHRFASEVGQTTITGDRNRQIQGFHVRKGGENKRIVSDIAKQRGDIPCQFVVAPCVDVFDKWDKIREIEEAFHNERRFLKWR